MARGRERAIPPRKESGHRPMSLTLVVVDHPDDLDTPPENSTPMPPTCFDTYAMARQMFDTVRSQEFSPRIPNHSLIISDYSFTLECDVAMDLVVLRNPNHTNSSSVAARWESWHTVEERWPFRVPVDGSVLKMAALERICREIWTSLRIVGETALVPGEARRGTRHSPSPQTGTKEIAVRPSPGPWRTEIC